MPHFFKYLCCLQALCLYNISNMDATCILLRVERFISFVNPQSRNDVVIKNSVFFNGWTYKN